MNVSATTHILNDHALHLHMRIGAMAQNAQDAASCPQVRWDNFGNTGARVRLASS